MRARLIAAALGTALLVAIGYGMVERLHRPAPPSALATPGPVSVIRAGNEVTLTGGVADPLAKRALVDAVLGSSDDLTVVDRLDVAPGVVTVDFTDAAPVFEAAAGIADFRLDADGDTVTLTGTAAKADQADAVQTAAEAAWARAHIVNALATER
ncbi:channel-forming protein ArfA/OmpATb [Mycolicibacter arupensis]|uniref:channel-forming protein ArfA/OmpATb n=1 Tax=Mycolicibacter arupensis TaxID=342002 RepID=UPI00122C6923|nr:BON domain-containing protein [Mycolicibacter arupensis]KAA1430740.1 BON domain-containing protein [Mycolicibacter arupensis]